MKLAWILTLLLCVMVVLLPACRRRAVVVPTAMPTLTPTPRSTPLPAVATQVPPGGQGNPIKLFVPPLVALDGLSVAQSELEAALVSMTELDVQVQLADNAPAALSALCASVSGQAAGAWLDAGAYLSAVGRGCGQPVLVLQRGSRTGETPILLVNAAAKIESLGDLTEASLCQLAQPEFYSWLAPRLMAAADSQQWNESLPAPKLFDTRLEMLQALAKGQCAAAGLPQSELDALSAELGAEAQQLTTLAQMPELPFAAFFLPQAVPLGAQEKLIAALSDSANAITLRGLLGAGDVVPLDAAALSAVQAFIAQTGLNFSQLSQ